MDKLITGLLSAISGGALWEGFKFIYPDIKRKLDSYKEANEILYRCIDPLLKSSDELFGKIWSLAKEDFATFINKENSLSKNPEHNTQYVLYLFAQFWSNIENIRLQNQYTSISRIKKGRQLIRYIETLESRNFRLLDRSIQRIIGESLIEFSSPKFKIMSLNEFIKNLNSDNVYFTQWIKLLENLFLSVDDAKNRQQILKYGIIIASMIDNFDPKYKIVRRREIYLNKLSKKSKKELERNLFKHYLTFINNSEKYYK
ncbi:MAG: hypothetical protein ABSF81_02690 [Bacteroidales bacterium]